MNHPILRTENLAVGYGKKIVVGGIDVSLFSGEVVSLLGPNGSGKSTVLKTLLGLQAPLGGSVLLGDAPLKSYGPSERAKWIGAALSDRPRPWGMTAIEVVEQGRFSRKRDDGLCLRALEDMGASNLANRATTELSDGELQKVHVARALAQEPSLLILDEPTSFLDQPRRIEVLRRLRKLASDRDLSVLLSLHDLDLALSHSDRCLLICDGEILSGSPEDLVLQGAFGIAYGQPRNWDPLDRPDPPYPEIVTEVELTCPEGLVDWVLRGLRRNGIRPGRSRNRLLVIDGEKGVRFNLDVNGVMFRHERLDSVVGMLLSEVQNRGNTAGRTSETVSIGVGPGGNGVEVEAR